MLVTEKVSCIKDFDKKLKARQIFIFGQIAEWMRYILEKHSFLSPLSSLFKIRRNMANIRDLTTTWRDFLWPHGL